MKRYICATSLLAALAAAGCVTVQGGDKPIKVDVTVTHKVDQQLENFYSFEKKYESSTGAQPATQPAMNSGGGQ